jgi:hypothetical protein
MLVDVLDPMSVPDILALIGAACALVMVLGALILLYRGTITLKEVNPEEAIKVQFKRLIDIQTRYPALGLFCVGVIFLIAAYWYESLSRTNTAKITEIEIPVKSEDPGDTVAHFMSDFGEVRIDNDQSILKTLPADLDAVEVTIKETGYKTWERAIHPNKATDGKLKMKADLEKVVSKPLKDPSQIDAAPESAPPLQKTGENSEGKVESRLIPGKNS